MNSISPTWPTAYIFSGIKVIPEYDNGAAPGSPSREYIYSGSTLLAKIEGGAAIYHHPDHLSNRVLTDSSGTVVGTQAHFPFGEDWYTTSTITKFRLTSYERDSESGNDYAMFRSSINRLGRFSSPDPVAGSITDPQSLNRYAYVVGDPINLIDPLGLENCYSAGTAPDGTPLIRCDATAPYPGGSSSGAGDPTQFGPGSLGGAGGAGGIHPPLLDGMELVGGVGGGGQGGQPEPPDIGNPPLPPNPFPTPQPPCPVSAASLDAYLKGSPMAGQGAALFDAGKRYDVNPQFMVALAGAETSFGRNITRGQYNAWNWMWNRTDPANSSFSSWAAGINSVTRGIAGRNYFGANPPLTTTSSIYARYCQGPDCVNGLRNLNTFLTQQGGDPNSLSFPCK